MTLLTLIRGVNRNSHPAMFPIGFPFLSFQPTVSAEQWVDNSKVKYISVISLWLHEHCIHRKTGKTIAFLLYS